MNAFDLIKATLVCGGLAFLVYSYPVIGQIVLIAGLGLVWASYAYNTIKNLISRKLA
jgi:hypothetical protein